MDRQDDPSLAGHILLYRRIPPWAERVTWDENDTPHASSFNFKDDESELSVHLASETTPDAILAGHDGFGLVQLTAQQAREACGAGIILCRCAEEPAHGHVLICGKISGGAAKKLSRAAVWVEGRWPQRDPPSPP
ncbi:MAG TPA: hypothetical protein VJ739_00370 [Gemmataceae bacterium]|nr:hypothetical protein [Gemmataceae bacterium]